jgi:hypothetical protein
VKIFGLQLILSTSESSLWWDNDAHHDGEGKPGWGVVIKLRGGDVVRPIGYPINWLKKDAPNVWFNTGPVRWKVLKFFCPIPILPFISVSLGQYGFYMGFKDFGVHHDEYKTWLPSSDVYVGSMALSPSVSIRRTRIK